MGYFIGGLLIGGTVAGFLAAVAGGVLGFARGLPAVVAVLAMAAMSTAVDFGWVRIRLPQNARQVPQAVFNRGPYVGAVQFGLELGTGVRTYLTAAAPLTLGVAAVLVGGMVEAVVAGTAFGAGRGVMTIDRFLSGSPHNWDTQLESRLPLVVRMCATVTTASVVAIALAS